nr:hypothetical protein [uncultured Dethiosulfovibrio sp.]
MRRKYIFVTALVGLLVLASLAMAATVTGWGEQVKGGAGMNAQLKGEPFTVPKGKTGVISNVKCDGDGFWIEGSLRRTFNPAQSANGFRLSAGTYYVYPNLKHNQSRAKVSLSVTF